MRPAPTTTLLLAAVLAGSTHAFLTPVPTPAAHRHLAPPSGTAVVVSGRGAAAAPAHAQRRRHGFLLTGAQGPLRAMLDTKDEEKEREADEGNKQAIVDQKAQVYMAVWLRTWMDVYDCLVRGSIEIEMEGRCRPQFYPHTSICTTNPTNKTARVRAAAG